MDNEITPDNWLMPNRIGYNKKIYYDFHPEKYPKIEKKNPCKCSKDVCVTDENVISLFPHQRIIRDYIQFDSPYRGILLYHELGSGKSAASIAAAEGFVERKKIYILTPASLAQNYENELMKVSKLGSSLKNIWTLLKLKDKTKDIVKKALDKYAITIDFIKKDNTVWIPLYQDDIPEAEIIIDKQKYKTLKSEDRVKVDNTITHIIKNRYTFISYNGLTQKLITDLGKEPFNNSFIVIDEIHNFISRIVNGSKLARSIYNNIMSANNCKIVLLSGTPIINNPYEIATLINLIRGSMLVYELNLLVKSEVPNVNDIKKKLIDSGLYQYVDEYNIDEDKRKIYISLLPQGYKKEEITSNKIIKDKWKASSDKIIDDIVKSLNKDKKVSIRANPSKNYYYALPNQKEEFDKTFMDLSDPEDPKVKNRDLFIRRILGTLSYYKTTGTEFFPKLLPYSIEYLNMTNHQLNIYSDVRNTERKLDDANKKRRGQGGLFAKQSSVYRAYSRMVCNFAFPDDIPRLYPKDIRKAIKSELDINDITGSNESLSSVDMEDKEDKKNVDKKTATLYEEQLSATLTKLSSVKDVFTMDSVKNLYSPKFARMIENINESPGTVLMYSQFRKVEGIGIFSMVLNAFGYKEITIKKQDGTYVFEDDDIWDEKYNNKRYVIFNEDKIKTNILMNLFNGSFSLLPRTLQEVIPDKDQLHGELVRLMMITQSGAEGISLKNVRRVLITEPFWNNVRINQVIGRAVRTCSHEQLPLDERNVQVFMYILKFTKEQIDKDFTLKVSDKGMTTDEHIIDIAKRKEDIVNNFLDMMKSAALDCINNSKQNNPANDYKCYHWPINVDNEELSYTNSINNDNKILEYRKFQKLKKDKGRVISKDGIKYVLMNDKIYDYYSYVNSGTLIPVSFNDEKAKNLPPTDFYAQVKTPPPTPPKNPTPPPKNPTPPSKKKESPVKDDSNDDKLYFNSKSKNQDPGKGVNEVISNSEEYTKLAKIKNWRKILSNFHECQFKYRGNTYKSIEHAFQGAKISMVNPEEGFKFTLESGSHIGTGDAEMARKNRKLVTLKKAQIKEWDSIKHNIIAEIAIEKYKVCPEAVNVLKATNNAQLWHIVIRGEPVRFIHLEKIRETLK